MCNVHTRNFLNVHQRDKKELFKNKILITIAMVGIFLLVVLIAVISIQQIKQYDHEIDLLLDQNEGYRSYIYSLEEKNQTIESLNMEIDKLQSELVSKQNDFDTLVEQLETYTKEHEKELNELALLDTYSYALYDTNGKRNDISVELLSLGDSLMKENNLDPNLLFGIIMVESEGHSDATNKYSGAAGLGQFMPDTGNWVYLTYIDKEGYYDHSVTPYEPETNIRMIVGYLSYLYNKYQGSTMDVIQQYCGGDYSFAKSYYNKVCNAVGFCIN